MITRRTLLTSGIAAAAVAPVNIALAEVLLQLPLRMTKSAPSAPPYAAIFDDADALSRSFAEQAAARGLRTLAIGDVSTLWFRELRPKWLPSGRALTGLTHAAHLLCLEQFACDVGQRVTPRVTAADLQADRWITWTIGV